MLAVAVTTHEVRGQGWCPRIRQRLLRSAGDVRSSAVLRPSDADTRPVHPAARGPCERARIELQNALWPTSRRCGDGRQHHITACRPCEKCALASSLLYVLCCICLHTSPVALRWCAHVTGPCLTGFFVVLAAHRFSLSALPPELGYGPFHSCGASTCCWWSWTARWTGAACPAFTHTYPPALCSSRRSQNSLTRSQIARSYAVLRCPRSCCLCCL